MNSRHLRENEWNWTSSREIRLRLKTHLLYAESRFKSVCVGIDHGSRKGSKRGGG